MPTLTRLAPEEVTTEADLAAACFGRGLPPEAERHLRLAGESFLRDEESLAHLQAARQVASEHVAVYIGLYRFYFYKHRLAEALEVARLCLAKAARDLGLAQDWRRTRPTDADFGSFEAVLPRFFLFTLKAYGYLQLRLGRLVEGRTALEKLVELDPDDKLGARRLLQILEKQIHGDED